MIAPYAAVVFEGSEPVAGLAGRLESRRLETVVGYKVVYAPLVRYLRVVDGGLVPGSGRRAGCPPRDLARALLRSGEADVVGLPPFAVGSELLTALRRARRPARAASRCRALDAQAPDPPVELRRVPRLAKPQDAQGAPPGCATSRCRLRRSALRRDHPRAGGARAAVHDADRGRGLDLPARARGRVRRHRRATRTDPRSGSSHGWVRGYLLRLDEAPIAYWLCSALRRHDAAQDRRLRPGLHRAPGRHLPADARDRGRDALDPASAACSTSAPEMPAYKQQFSSDGALRAESRPVRPDAPRAPDQRDANRDPRPGAARARASST